MENEEYYNDEFKKYFEEIEKLYEFEKKLMRPAEKNDDEKEVIDFHSLDAKKILNISEFIIRYSAESKRNQILEFNAGQGNTGKLYVLPLSPHDVIKYNGNRQSMN